MNGLIEQLYEVGVQKYNQTGERTENQRKRLTPIIDKLSVEDKKQIKELFLRYSIEDILKSITDFKYIKIVKVIKSICLENNIKLYRFRDIFFEILDNEEERRKELAGAYYREDIKEKTRQIL